MTNALICYKVYHKEKKLKLKFTHYEFICSICIAWIDDYGYWPDRYGDGSKQYVSPVTCTGRRNRANVPYVSKVNSDRFLPEEALKRRLNSEL